MRTARHSHVFRLSLQSAPLLTLDQYRTPTTVPARRALLHHAPGGGGEARTPELTASRRLTGLLGLTGDAQVDGRAGLVLPVPLVHRLHVVSPGVAGGRRQDHQLVLQGDGSASEKKRQGQGCSTARLVVREVQARGRPWRNDERRPMRGPPGEPPRPRTARPVRTSPASEEEGPLEHMLPGFLRTQGCPGNA